jgi:hypothetical protein
MIVMSAIECYCSFSADIVRPHQKLLCITSGHPLLVHDTGNLLCDGQRATEQMIVHTRLAVIRAQNLDG